MKFKAFKTLIKQLLKENRVSLLLLFASTVSFAAVFNSISIDSKAGDLPLASFDSSVMNHLSEFRSPRLNQIMTDLTALGSFSLLSIVYLGFLFYFLIKKRYSDTLYITFIVLGAILLIDVLKEYFHRPRPNIIEQLAYSVSTNSFPSGHTLASCSIYLSIAWLIGAKQKSFLPRSLIYLSLSTVIFLIGFSRVFLGVHYPTDVLAGLLVGLAWTSLMTIIYKIYTSAR